MHQSVLAKEIEDLFAPCRIRNFVDGTLGAGGHAHLILSAHPEIECFYGFDQDVSALEIAKERLSNWSAKIKFIHAPFGDLQSYVDSCEGVLLDIGVSSMQLDRPERGFSFYKEGPLDMRMDQTSSVDAKKIINHYSEQQLGMIFREFGEEKKWRQAARAIVSARKRKPLTTTQELVEALKPVLGWARKHQHPATRIFQALRIEVNQELEQLKLGVQAAIDSLTVGGRLAVITFHSLEDRIVKHLFKEHPDVNVLTKKPLVASREEMRLNKRSRSAKLRCIEKTKMHESK